MTTKTETIEGTVAEYVTAVIGGQLFGLPISRVQDVFMPERLTRVPLASSEIGRPNNCPPITAVTYSATVPSMVSVLVVMVTYLV